MFTSFKRAALLLSISLIAVFAPVVQSPAVAAVVDGAPGGKTNFVVSLGGLYGNRTDNFVRIGTYAFDPVTGTVQGTWWKWNQTYRVGRESTSTLSGTACGVINCYVRTATGFTQDAPEAMTGTYTLDGRNLAITWPGELQERWTVTDVLKADKSVDPTSVRLTWRGGSANYRANAGYAWGSNASLSQYVPVREITTDPVYHRSYRYERSAWYNGTVTPALGSGIHVNEMAHCNTPGTCIGFKREKVPVAADGCKDSEYGYLPDSNGVMRLHTDIYNYIGEVGGDRRTAWWGWTGCLAYDSRTKTVSCYTGNSHTYPMLQAIDDAGRLRGWVALQVFYDMRSTYTPLMDYFDVGIVYPYESGV